MTADRLEGSDRLGIIVGLDGSDGSQAAIRWAAAHVDQFGPIQPVTTWRYPWWLVPNPFPGAGTPPPTEQFQRRAEASARREIASLGIDSVADPIVCRAAAGPTLVALGEQANLIAVGTRGRDAVTGTIMGSTGMYVVTHSTVPVVVIPRSLPLTPRRGPVVVGVDGSMNGSAALRWAMANTPAETELIAVMAYLDPVDVSLRSERPSESEDARASDELLHAIIRAARRAVGPDAHPVSPRVLYGEPRDVLEDLANTAQMLVLGARGHRGVAHLLLGSITDALIRDPQAPTVVVPDWPIVPDWPDHVEQSLST